jgi:hypothetical protein
MLPRGSGIPAQPVRGLDDAPVAVIETDTLDLWVSEVPGPPPEATVRHAIAHDRVIRAAMTIQTPLPLRFGQIVEGEATLRSLLAAREEALLRALDRVRGTVEMTIRVLLEEVAPERPEMTPDVPCDAPGPGRLHLERLRLLTRGEQARRERAEFLQEQIGNAVALLVRAEVRTPLSPFARTRSLTIAHLVAREHVEDYRAALHALRAETPAAQLMISGPWAPYSFAPRA